MKINLLLSFIVISLFSFSCKNNKTAELTEAIPVELIEVPPAYEAIRERGNKLIALTAKNTPSYFLHNGRTMGYEYEMLNKLAEHLGLKLQIKVVENLDSIFDMLNRGEGDLVAYSMTVTNQRREVVDFTKRLYDSPQCLVQKKPSNWRELLPHQIDNMVVRNVLDIGEDFVYVRQGSAYYSRLMNLSDEIGDSLNIAPVKGVVSTFDLIDLVEKGQIKYTVADQEIASLYASYNNSIDYATPISMPQKKAWAVRHNSPELLEDINKWLVKYKRYKEYYFIYDKYFNNPGTYKRLRVSAFSSRTGKLSSFDAIIKREALTINWDWRLLAALVYQESHFDQSQESWMGAKGLMQVLPATAEMHGYNDISLPEANIKAGISHLKYIEKRFSDIDESERLKFTLAGYNVGVGHIYDAQRLAIHLGKDPNIWDGNVAEALLLKSEKKYYELPACRNGYCRGSEPYNYVNEILQRHEDYKMLLQ